MQVSSCIVIFFVIIVISWKEGGVKEVIWYADT